MNAHMIPLDIVRTLSALESELSPLSSFESSNIKYQTWVDSSEGSYGYPLQTCPQEYSIRSIRHPEFIRTSAQVQISDLRLKEHSFGHGVVGAT